MGLVEMITTILGDFPVLNGVNPTERFVDPDGLDLAFGNEASIHIFDDNIYGIIKMIKMYFLWFIP